MLLETNNINANTSFLEKTKGYDSKNQSVIIDQRDQFTNNNTYVVKSHKPSMFATHAGFDTLPEYSFLKTPKQEPLKNRLNTLNSATQFGIK